MKLSVLKIKQINGHIKATLNLTEFIAYKLDDKLFFYQEVNNSNSPMIMAEQSSFFNIQRDYVDVLFDKFYFVGFFEFL